MSRTERLARLMRVTELDRLARLTWRGLLVLTYHRIGEPTETDDPDLFSATVDDFDRQMELLADRVEFVTAGAADLDLRRPARRVAISFDDGYADQTLAADVLRARSLPASFFICTGFLDRPHPAWWDEIAWLVRDIDSDLPASRWLPNGLRIAARSAAEIRHRVSTAYKLRVGLDGGDFLDWLADCTRRPRLSHIGVPPPWMSWADVRGLRSAGMEIGAHSVTHPVLANLSRAQQRDEIRFSLTRLAEELTERIDTFAYPVGARTSFDATTFDVLRELGVRRAFSFSGGVNHRHRDEPFDVLRAGVFRDHSPDVVAAMAALPHLLCAPRRHT
jgi:peptidoglycan/xylan/chitin deacetylase (PgdA/CDA1 family)